MTADLWKPEQQWDSRYLWMPLEIGGGKMHLPEPREWTIAVGAGEVVIEDAKIATTHAASH